VEEDRERKEEEEERKKREEKEGRTSLLIFLTFLPKKNFEISIQPIGFGIILVLIVRIDVPGAWPMISRFFDEFEGLGKEEERIGFLSSKSISSSSSF
jgi:hypothetical protein